MVGAGPAGCAAAAAALQARPRARVLLVDRADFPRDKICGDGIADAAIGLLARLGLPASTVVAGHRPMNSFRVQSPGGVLVARTMTEPVWVIPRAVFDARLLDAVRARGVHFLRHAVRKLDVLPDRVIVDGQLHARAVIGADGAESAVRRAVDQPPNPSRSMAIALRGYGPELPDQRGAQLITMTAQHWPAYAWSFPIGDGRANLGYGQLLEDGPVSKDALLTGLQTLLPGADPDAPTLRAHRLPMSTWRPPLRPGRIVLAGDAQSLVNPLSGEGIYYALISGCLAGVAALHGRQAGRVYRTALRRRLGAYLRHATVLAHATRWPALMDAVLRGAAVEQSTFDDLVRLGLQDGRITPRLVRAAVRPRNWRPTAAITPASSPIR